MPDDRWRTHDPRKLPGDERRAWKSVLDSQDTAPVLWLGIEYVAGHTVVDYVGYARLDETDFPHDLLWHGGQLPSRDLTAFERYAGDPAVYDAYSYTASLAWLGTQVRLLTPAPKTLAGFGEGDYLVF